MDDKNIESIWPSDDLDVLDTDLQPRCDEHSAGTDLNTKSDFNARQADPLAPDHQAKIHAWRQQHGALLATAYRITLTSRRDGLVTYVMGNQPDGTKRTYTATEVEILILSLRRENARGYDIYITPIDAQHHYLVIDDIDRNALARLKAAGYQPALVQRSSPNNYQAILKISKQVDNPDEQSHANTLVVMINQEYGDVRFSGVIHPFRMAGFSNRKPGKGNPFTIIVEASASRLCEQAAAELERLRQQDKARQAKVEQARRQQMKRREQAGQRAVKATTQPPVASSVDHDAIRAFQRGMARMQGLARKKNWPLDDSRVDWAVVTDMLKDGWSPEQVERAILAASPSIRERHRNPEDYAGRTVRNAMMEAKVQEARHKRERDAQASGPKVMT